MLSLPAELILSQGVICRGVGVRPCDGFIGDTPEATLRHLGALSRRGLAAMDPVILEIMRRQCG